MTSFNSSRAIHVVTAMCEEINFHFKSDPRDCLALRCANEKESFIGRYISAVYVFRCREEWRAKQMVIESNLMVSSLL